MRQSGEDFTLIDVRERDEQEKGTIAGAVCLPRGILEVNIDQVTTDKDRKHRAVLRRRISRSALAALNLKKMGFRNVHIAGRRFPRLARVGNPVMISAF